MKALFIFIAGLWVGDNINKIIAWCSASNQSHTELTRENLESMFIKEDDDPKSFSYIIPWSRGIEHFPNLTLWSDPKRPPELWIDGVKIYTPETAEEMQHLIAALTTVQKFYIG